MITQTLAQVLTLYIVPLELSLIPTSLHPMTSLTMSSVELMSSMIYLPRNNPTLPTRHSAHSAAVISFYDAFLHIKKCQNLLMMLLLTTYYSINHLLLDLLKSFC